LAGKKNYDLLGGSISNEKPGKAKRNNDVHGSKHDVESSGVYGGGDYFPAYEESTDALTVTGEADKPKKKGLLSGIFGKRKKPAESFEKEEYRNEYVVKDIRIKDIPATIETGSRNDEPAGDREEEFFEEKLPVAESKEPAPSSLKETGSPKKVMAKYSQNICYLCGEKSPVPFPQFRFGGDVRPEDSAPLCRTCLRAVKTLMKYRDPADEKEIKSEWQYLAPGLDEERADALINEGRRNNNS
jgi:hypothetical protein